MSRLFLPFSSDTRKIPGEPWGEVASGTARNLRSGDQSSMELNHHWLWCTSATLRSAPLRAGTR